MKKLFSVLAVSLLLVACASAPSTTTTTPENKSCSVLNVYNTGEYIGEHVLADFEKEFGVRVNYSLFASNEEMYTKLLGGTSYDLLIPSDYMIARLMKEGLLQPVDKSLIPNMSNLYEGTLKKEYDLQNEYSVPYFWGNVGIVYDKTIVDPADVKAQGWDVLANAKYAGKIYMYDSERDSFMVALKALGYSMNTTDTAELNKAYEWLVNVHKTMNPAYVTDEAIDGLVYGEKAMGVMYSGDAAYIYSENNNMEFYVPESGTNIWTDAMVIPANAACPEMANKFMNFILEDRISLDNTLTVGYASSNKNVLRDMTAEGGPYAENAAYLPRTDYPKDEVFVDNESVRKVISELWVKVKNQ